MVQPEQIAAPQRRRATGQIVGAHPTDPCGGEHRADARASVDGWRDAALLQRLHHANVREPFHAATAKNESDAARRGRRTAHVESLAGGPDRKLWHEPLLQVFVEAY